MMEALRIVGWVKNEGEEEEEDSRSTKMNDDIVAHKGIYHYKGTMSAFCDSSNI